MQSQKISENQAYALLPWKRFAIPLINAHACTCSFSLSAVVLNIVDHWQVSSVRFKFLGAEVLVGYNAGDCGNFGYWKLTLCCMFLLRFGFWRYNL